MGQIVAGFGTAHIMMARGSAGEKGERVYAGMKEIGRRVRALRPDVLVIASSDHLYNYDLNVQVPFAVATDATHVPFGDLGLPDAPLPGHADFASGFLRLATARDFDLARLQDYKPDHGVVLPALICAPRRNIPVVPVIINTAMDPLPRLARAWALGGLLRDYVAQARPQGERVVVMGTGGLSHWLGVPEMGRVNPDFDRAVMGALVTGQGERLAAWSAEQVEAEGGNGGQEILAWVMMAGSLPGVGGEQIYYENVPEWVTGMGGVHLMPERAIQRSQ